MSNDTIFFTQLGSIIVYILALFSLYKIFVDQKDVVIQVLRERLVDKEAKIKELESQTPDALASALSSRIDVSLKEIARLKADGDQHQEEVSRKEAELHSLKERLNGFAALIRDSDLVCKKCGAPLSRRTQHPIYGQINGHEVEAEVEYTEYECGFSLRDGEELSPCSR